MARIDIGDIERNDIPTALAFYDQEEKAGGISEQDSEVLLMLQDDPDALMAALESRPGPATE